MPKSNFSIIEHVLFLGYLKRNYPDKLIEEINSFILKFNYDINSLKLYLDGETRVKKSLGYKYIFANLFSYLSLFFLQKKYS